MLLIHLFELLQRLKWENISESIWYSAQKMDLIVTGIIIETHHAWYLSDALNKIAFLLEACALLKLAAWSPHTPVHTVSVTWKEIAKVTPGA